MGYILIPSSFILDAARDQYGSTAALVSTAPGHAYDWAARVPGSSTPKPIDLQGYSIKKYGSDWRVLLTHLGADGWAWFNPLQSDVQWQIQPVLIMASEFRREVAQVNWAIQNLETNIRYVRDWLKGQMGKTWKILPRTQVIDCGKSAQQLLDLARSTQDPASRYALLFWARDTYIAAAKRTSPNIIYIIATMTGNHPNEDFGAAATSNYCVVSSFASSVKIDPAALTAIMRRIAYAIGHEGLHCCGLGHTDQSIPGAANSIMLWGEPPSAELVVPERQFLDTSPYLHTLAP